MTLSGGYNSGAQRSLQTVSSHRNGSSISLASLRTVDLDERLASSDEVQLLKQISQDEQLPPPPDGGTQAWFQVVAGSLVCVMTWGLVTSYGVFQSFYRSYLDPVPSNSEIAWIGTIQIFCLLFMGTASGRASDAGFGREAVYLGSSLVVFGLIMTSFATRYHELIVTQGFCVGIGMGIMYMPGLSTASSYFDKIKPIAVSIVSAGTGVGGLIYPAMAQQLLPRIGFEWTMRCMAVVTGIFAITIAILLRPRVPPRKSGPLIAWSAFTELPYLFFCLGFFLIYWAIYFCFYFIDSYGHSFTSMTEKDAINLLMITNGLGILGRIIPGIVAAKWLGPLNTAVPTAVMVATIIFSWIAVGHSEPAMMSFAAIYGFFASAIQALFAVSLAALTDDLGQLGVRMGMVFTVVAFAALTGSPIAGAIIRTADGSYLGAQIWAGCTVLLGAGCLVCARFASTGLVLMVRK